MKATTIETVERERERERESYTLVNKSRLLNSSISTTLCTLKKIYINKKTEMKPIYWVFVAAFFVQINKLLNFKINKKVNEISKISNIYEKGRNEK